MVKESSLTRKRRNKNAIATKLVSVGMNAHKCNIGYPCQCTVPIPRFCLRISRMRFQYLVQFEQPNGLGAGLNWKTPHTQCRHVL